jgi:hypothetical protein
MELTANRKQTEDLHRVAEKSLDLVNCVRRNYGGVYGGLDGAQTCAGQRAAEINLG